MNFPIQLTYDVKTRLIAFCDYQDASGLPWHRPDLMGWRDALLAEGRSPATVKTYLATVRSAYRQLLRDNRLRDILYGLTPVAAPPSDRKAFVDEALVRLQNAVHPDHAPVKLTVVQDAADSQHLRLSARQAEQPSGSRSAASWRCGCGMAKAISSG